MKLKVKEELFDLLVTATCRLAFPSSMISITSSGLDTNLSLAPYRNHINLFKILLLENLQCTPCCYPEPYMTSDSLLLVNFAVQLVECLLLAYCTSAVSWEYFVSNCRSVVDEEILWG